MLREQRLSVADPLLSEDPAGNRRRLREQMAVSPSDARRCRCRRSLCTGSSPSGARRGRCRHSLCTCSSVAHARRGHGPCEASWLQKDGTSGSRQGSLHWLGSHCALRACGVFLVAPLVHAPPALSCPPHQPPGHPCNPTSYSLAYPPCGVFLRCRCVASTPAWCPCQCSLVLNRYARVKRPPRSAECSED